MPEIPAGWEAVIGMEVHVQLQTRSKMFCRCPADYAGAPPNSNVCPVCLGLPGVLPVINRAAVEQVLRTALALGAEIPRHTKFDRKNYFYPDLPKGYQISQYDLPMSRGGELTLEAGRSVRITRVHLEEDTGKNIHAGDQLRTAHESYIDFNRSGMPLMEVVSEPDLRSAEDARDYAMALRRLLRHIGASEADMEKGQLRAEANVSVRRTGDTELGVKTELKNINSFRALYRAVGHEIARQVRVLEAGGRVVQETRGWSEADQSTFSQRSKEFAEDYRYFPEPDLPPLELDPAWVEELRASLPELPAAREGRYREALGLSAADASQLAADRPTAEYFDAAVTAGAEPKPAANWVLNEVARRRQEERPGEFPPASLAELLRMLGEGRVNRDQARQVLDESWSTGRAPSAVAESLGLLQVTDSAAIERWAAAVIEASPQAAADFRSGKEQAIGPLVGQVVKRSAGQANAKIAAEVLRRLLIR